MKPGRGCRTERFYATGWRPSHPRYNIRHSSGTKTGVTFLHESMYIIQSSKVVEIYSRLGCNYHIHGDNPITVTLFWLVTVYPGAKKLADRHDGDNRLWISDFTMVTNFFDGTVLTNIG